MNDERTEVPESVEDQLEFIRNANDLGSIARLHMQVMAKREIIVLVRLK